MDQLNAILSNPPLLLLILVWSMIWKGLALWRAAKRGDKVWFVVFLILNMLGIPEIIYLLVTNKDEKESNV
ncbi:MAG TPA: DUF5652 family protein [bacterium]|nr:DUF5652 family protein [bacterium]